MDLVAINVCKTFIMLTIALQLFFSVYRNKNILCLKNLFYVTLVAFKNILKIFSIHFTSPGWIKIAERFFSDTKDSNAGSQLKPRERLANHI